MPRSHLSHRSKTEPAEALQDVVKDQRWDSAQHWLETTRRT